MELTLVVAATLANGIGHNGTLPWRLPKEMAHFVKVTSTAPQRGINAVVMGRKSWESIPARFRPLKNRLNIVVSRQAEYSLGTLETPNLALLRPSLPSALAALNQDLPEESQLHHTFIIGGASLYAEALSLPAAKRIIITRVLSPAYEQCDVFFPDFQSLDSRWRQASHQEMEDWTGLSIPQGIQEERGTTYEYQMWVR